MPKTSNLEPFRLSFYKYRLNAQDLRKFKTLFYDWLGFTQLHEIDCQTFIYGNRSAYYIIELCDEVYLPKLDAIGLHLVNRKLQKEKLLSDIDSIISTKVEAYNYVENICETSKSAKYLQERVLPLPGMQVGDIKFYFTISEDFKPGGIFYKDDLVISRKIQNKQEKYRFIKKGYEKNNLSLYHHHVAFFGKPEEVDNLESLFKSDLKMKENGTYKLESAQQYVKTFKLNRILLNTIRPTNVNHDFQLELEDLYSHGALGTNNIINFALKINSASNSTGSQVEIIPMGGNHSKHHYEDIRSTYSHILTPRQIEEIENYHINFDANLQRPKDHGFQFFFRSVLGLTEGIQTNGNFSFMPRAGEGVTKGISLNIEDSKC